MYVDTQKLKKLLCVPRNNLSEESAKEETDAAGDVPNTIRIENNREKQSTQYLTRFGDVPTSSGQGEREILFIQQSITTYSFFKEFPREIFRGIFRDIIHEGSSPYL